MKKAGSGFHRVRPTSSGFMLFGVHSVHGMFGSSEAQEERFLVSPLVNVSSYNEMYYRSVLYIIVSLWSAYEIRVLLLTQNVWNTIRRSSEPAAHQLFGEIRNIIS